MTLCQPDPILRFTDGTKIVDILAPGSGWKMADPYWNPQIAQYKGGGSKVNPSIAPGQRLVSKEYDNVVETIPLVASGIDEEACIATINELLSLARQSADYWAESYEFDDVWMEAKPAGINSQIGYAQISQMRIPELINPYGQPFFSPFEEAVMEGLSLIVEREPLWRSVPPGTLIGPLYNLLRNPDFELWNNGIIDSQPDSWSDLETIQITGDNSRQETAVHSGNYALKVHVGGSTLTGRFKGVAQTVSGIQPLTTYTIVAWVRSDGVSNGVGRILVTYSSQLELYRSSTRHGWTLYTGTFTTDDNDMVAVNIEILTTAAFTDGTFYIDSLMLLEGNWQQEAIAGVLPYLTSSHIVNHWDQDSGVIEAGDINYVDVYDVPGNVDALVRLEVVNNTTPASLSNPGEVIAVLRAGMRRSGDVFNFQGFQDPSGPIDTTASSDNRINSGTLTTTGWTTVSTFSIQTPSITIDNVGRYRLFVRVFDTRTGGVLTLQVRVRYWIGSGIVGIKTLEAVTVPILNNWCIVDLTPMAGINWDTKFNPNTPSQFGFEIQMRRTANTDQGRIDYALLLPTDGGILVCTIDPAIIQFDGIVADCTVSAPKVFGAHIIEQWHIISELGNVGAIAVDMAVFQNVLFIKSGAFLLRYQNNAITSFVVADSPVLVYNNRLWTFILGNGRASDGTSFPGSIIFTFDALATIRDALDWQGYIFLSGSVAAGAVIYRWNGSDATATTLVLRADITEFLTMVIYANNLYVVGEVAGANNIYRLDINTGALTLVLSTASASNFLDFTVFDNKLWYTDRGASIYSYDGSTWTTHAPFPALSPNYRGINTIDGVLFVTGRDTSVSPASILVIKSTDGVTFEVDFHPENTTALFFEGTGLIKYQGQLIMVVSNADGSVNYLYAKNLTANEYQPGDYQLIPFASPPKTRHKFIFNWDRKVNINNIDDAALVGIGFIPRYLALRGRG